LDRHQGEAMTSQLGWHLAKPHSIPPISEKILLKKRGKSTRGGTRPKSSKYKEETAKKEKKKETANRKKKKGNT